MTLISQLDNKKILVLGYGEEGVDNLLFLKNNISYKKIGVADVLSLENIPEEKRKYLEEDVNLHFGKNYISAIKEYDVIMKSPGVPMFDIEIREDQILTSQSDIFLQNCKGTVIGITGTKGKSTTSVLIYNLLKSEGFSVYLVGNIGAPSLSKLKNCKTDDIFVYELSSFQLATIKKSPHIAIILNIFPDHLDKHKDFEEYVYFKKNITKFQSEKDFLIYNKNDQNVKEIAEKSVAEKIPFSFEKRVENISSFIDPVLEVAKIFKISEDKVYKSLSHFKGLPHRKEYIGEYQSIHFYNDSAATIPEATIHMIDDFSDIDTIILGGSGKGVDFQNIIDKLKSSNIENIVILKGTPLQIEEDLRKDKKNVFIASDMKEAVEFSFKNTKEGKKCVLSPGFASFNMFKNYKERGEMFKSYVHKLSKENF